MFKKYQKRIVLFLLFVFPLICFLLLSTGENNFTKLDVISSDVKDIALISPTSNTTFKDNISVVCFLGNEINKSESGILNLDEKVYKKFLDYKKFQVIAIYPQQRKPEADELIKKISKFTNMQNWKFIGMSESQIKELYTSFKVLKPLVNMYSQKAFIIDKFGKLRGRKNDGKEKDELLSGYDLNSISELNDKLKDDLKVLYYEYYAAFKERNKNKADRKEVGK
mgnify:CR=1 FL=1